MLALLGLGTVVFLHRGLMAWVIDLAHRYIKRIPGSDQLPTQRDIIAFYLWALVTVGCTVRRVRGPPVLPRQRP